MKIVLFSFVFISAVFSMGCGQPAAITPENLTDPGSNAQPDQDGGDVGARKTIFKSPDAIETVYLDKVITGNILLQLKAGGYQLLSAHPKSAEKYTSEKYTAEKYTDDCDIETNYYEHYEWASPFLVSLDKVCVLDKTTKSMRTVFKNALIQDSFSTAFLYKDQTHYYFLINSRPMNSKGFIHLKRVPIQVSGSQNNLALESLDVVPLVDEIVLYSGPMSIDPTGTQFFYTGADYDSKTKVSTATIFTMPTEKLKALVETQKQDLLSFTGLTEDKPFTLFHGLSSWMSVGTNFLFYTEEMDPKLPKAYDFIDRKTKKIFKSKQDLDQCFPEGLAADQVILRCPNDEIATMRDVDYVRNASLTVTTEATP